MRRFGAQWPDMPLVVLGQRGLDHFDIATGRLRDRVDIDLAAADEILEGLVEAGDGGRVPGGDVFGVPREGAVEDATEHVEA